MVEGVVGQHDVHFYGCVVYVTLGSIRLCVCVCVVGRCGVTVCGVWVGVHCELCSPHPPLSFRSSHCPAKQALLAAKFRAEYEQLPQATLVSSVHLSHAYEGLDGACCGQ